MLTLPSISVQQSEFHLVTIGQSIRFFFSPQDNKQLGTQCCTHTSAGWQHHPSHSSIGFNISIRVCVCVLDLMEGEIIGKPAT
jgi:hypothetical protein